MPKKKKKTNKQISRGTKPMGLSHGRDSALAEKHIVMGFNEHSKVFSNFQILFIYNICLLLVI